MASCVGAAARKHFDFVQASLAGGSVFDVLAAFLECRLVPSVAGVRNFMEIYKYEAQPSPSKRGGRYPVKNESVCYDVFMFLLR
jgi:hypothetical protein